MRPARELIDVDDPAWPEIEASVRGATNARVLPVNRDEGVNCLYRLQVTARSPLGALALNCGGLLFDHGWLRLLGGGHDGLPDLATANGLEGEPPPRAPGLLEIGRDILGGRFAINGGALPGDMNKICYFGPDTLSWEPLSLVHGDLIRWAISGGSAAFYNDLRWPGWEEEASALPLDQGLSVHPPLFSQEGRIIDRCSRRGVPWAELVTLHDEFARQLADVPEGSPVRIRITDP